MGILGYQVIGGGGGGMCGMELYVIVQESKVRARCSPNFASHDQLFNFNSDLEKQKFVGDIGHSREKSMHSVLSLFVSVLGSSVLLPGRDHVTATLFHPLEKSGPPAGRAVHSKHAGLQLCTK